MSDNKKKYIEAFSTALSVDNEFINEKLEYNSIPEWDSIGHMTLISALEDKFNITVETDDVIDFSSFKKGMEILSKKHKINF